MSKKFKQYAIIIGVNIKGVLVKAHNSISMVERYYSLIRHTYQIITTELSDLNKNIALQIAFKVINNFISLDSLVLTLLVFRAYL